MLRTPNTPSPFFDYFVIMPLFFHSRFIFSETPEDFSEESVTHLDYLIERAASLHAEVASQDENDFADAAVAHRVFSMVHHIVRLMQNMYSFFGERIPMVLMDPTALLQARELCGTPGNIFSSQYYNDIRQSSFGL